MSRKLDVANFPEIDKWVGCYKIRAFSWIDGMRIYFNVQGYTPGQSIKRPPVWDKTVYITDNNAGRRLVREFTGTMIKFVESMRLPEDIEITLTALSGEEGVGR